MAMSMPTDKGFLEHFNETALLRFFARLLIVVQIVFGLPVSAAAAVTELAVTGTYQLIGSKRVSSTLIDFTYRAEITNSGTETFPDVAATVVSQAASTMIVDGAVFFGEVTGGATLFSQDTFTIRQNRTVPFNPNDLVWTVQANRAPAANAGAGQTMAVGGTVTLDGSGSSDPDGDDLTYAWSFVAVPPGSTAQLSDAAAIKPTFVIDRPGDYTLQLVVDDGKASSLPAQVTISTLNTPPVAVARLNQAVRVGQTAQLDGSASSDVDGDPLTFRWTLTSQPAGSTAILSDSATVTPTLPIDKAGQYTVELIVNDGTEDSTPTPLVISTENTPPVAHAGSDRKIALQAEVVLDGSASMDIDGDTLSFLWSLIGKPANSTASLSDPSLVKPKFTADLPGDYVAQLIVNDGKANSAPASVILTTENTKPVANAGTPQTVPLQTTVTLDGSLSSDAENDPLTYLWSLTSIPFGSAATLSDPGAQQPQFLVDLPGSYIAQLIVNDGHLASDPANVIISTENSRPVANAGPDQEVKAGDAVQLDGGASGDADHQPLTYQWSFTAKPQDSTATLSDPASATPTFVADRTGAYVLQLIVNDGQLNSEADTVTIEAKPVMVTVPNVVGETQAAAEATLIAAQLTVGAITAQASDTVPAGTVISQAPVAGTEVEKASAVALAVSTGPALVSVPNLVGQTQAAATAAISAAQLTLGTVTPAASDTVPAGQVISQNPLAGASVAKGSAVNLVVSTGAPAQQIDRAPQITSTPVSAAVAGAQYQYAVAAFDLDGDNLTFSLPIAPVGMSVDATTGLIVWTPTDQQVGSHSVTVRVSDGQTHVEQPFAVAVRRVASPLTINAEVTPSIANPGEIIAITAQVTGAAGSTITMTQAGTPLQVNGGVAQFSAAQPGVYPIEVVATAVNGQSASVTVFARVRNEGDVTAPTVAITAPTEDARVLGSTEVIGRVTDNNLFRYRLLLAPSGSNDFTEIAVGAQEVANANLGTLDPSRFANGLYQLVLVAEDVNGHASQAAVNILIEGQAKPGVVRLGFTDMVVPVAGIPISIERTYDSRVKTGRDFGIGWSLDVRQGSYRNNREPGRGWNVVGSGGFFNIPCSRAVELASHVTEIRLSDRERYAFRPVASFSGFGSVISGGCLGTVSFVQTDGLRGATLVPLESTNVFFVNGSGVLTFDLGDTRFGEPWQPDRVRLKTADGRTFDLDIQDGVTRLEDRIGNQLFVTNGGIVNGAGVGVQFQRDNRGRLTQITDPRGNSVRYEYDANDDLVRFVNQAGEVTSYEYFDTTPHHLSAIRLPDGRLVNSFDYDESGRLAKACTELGCATSEYDLVGRTQTNVDATGRRVTYVYDAEGNVLSQTDGLGNTISYEYDAKGNVVRQTDAEGHVTLQNWDANSNLLSVTQPFSAGQNPADFTTTYTYDARGFMLRSRLPSGGELNNGYDASGNLLSMTNEAGTILSQFTYDASGRRTGESDRFGTLNYGYDGDGLIATITDSAGVTATFNHDAAGNVMGFSRDGVTANFGYDALGRQNSFSDSNGVSLRYEYDIGSDWAVAEGSTIPKIERTFTATGAPLQVVQADGTAVRWDYDAAGRVTAEVDALGQRTTYAYDAGGRLLSETDRSGHTTNYERDGNGQVLAITNPENERTEYTYFPDGARQSITNGEGETWSFAYTPTTITVRDPLLRQVTTETNPQGLITKVHNADGTSRAWTYLVPTALLDGAESPTSFTDEGGRVRNFSYDAEGLLVGATDLAGVGATYAYGSNGLRTITDAEGEAINFTYNGRGDIETLRFGDGSGKTIAYHPSGKVASVTLTSGASRALAYDAVGRLAHDERGQGESFVFDWDGNGNLLSATDALGTVSYTYDPDGRPTRLVGSSGESIAYVYDGAGRVVRQTVSNRDGSQTRQTSYDYDRAGRLTRVVDPNGGETRFEYDQAGRLAKRTMPNGVATTYTYDLRDQIVGISHANASGTILSSVSYSRNPGGEPNRVTWQDGSYVQLTYDAALRVTEEAFHDATDQLIRRIEYRYDQTGNRIARIVDGARTDYSYGAAHRLLSADGAEPQSYEYDADGRTRRIDRGSLDAALAYNFAGQIRTVDFGGRMIGYTYDAAGRRIAAVDGAGTRRFLKAPGVLGSYDNPQAVLDGASNLLQTYVYAGNEPLQRSSGGSTRYYLTDAMGSVIGITDEAGNVVGTTKYDAFGQPVDATGDMSLPADAGGDFRFHGQWIEAATGLYDLRARDYDPVTGRFLAPDPAEPDLFEPESLNRYQFANSNPYFFADPTGRFTLVSVNISINIQATLRSIAVNIAKDYFIDKARSVAGSLLVSALRNFTALEGFNPWGFIGVTNPGEAGRIWEQKVQQFVCSVFPDVMRDIVWFEPTIAGGSATNNGYGCPGGGNGGFAKRGSAKPDFVISKTPPEDLEERRLKAYLIGETKWRLKTFYNAYVKNGGRQRNQFEQIAEFAKQRVYSRTAIFVALLNGTNGAESLELTKLLTTAAASKGIIPIMASAQ